MASNQTNEAGAPRYQTRPLTAGGYAVIDTTTGLTVKEYKTPNHAGKLAQKMNKAVRS